MYLMCGVNEMRIIYIDENFVCHTKEEKGYTAHETNLFNGKCDVYIEGYRYVPAGQSWTRGDGVIFLGEMICPAIDFQGLDAAQRENEQAALEHVGISGENAPLEEAKEFRAAIDTVISDIDDGKANDLCVLFSHWNGDGIQYIDGDRVRYDGKLYKCLLSHMSQPDWPPDTAVSLFAVISDPGVEWPEWVLPTGAHNAYQSGDRVFHNGKKYISLEDNNVWEPGVYGWEVF